MADEGTLATTQQVLDSVGANASSDQTAETLTNRAILIVESEMELAFGKLGKSPGLVANYSSITASYKQYLAGKASDKAALRIVNQNQQTWSLSVTQSKLNVLLQSWKGFLSDLKDNSSEIVTEMNL